MFAALVIDNDLIATGMIFQQLGNQRISYHGNMCIGISCPDRHHRRQSHNGIANPVGGPDNDATDFFWFETFQGEWITRKGFFGLSQRKGFVNQHDRDPVPDRIGQFAGMAEQLVLIVVRDNLALALRTGQNFEQIFG